MRSPARPLHLPLPARESGVALFVALIFLLVLTILGVTALNTNTLQTRMSASAAQLNFSFQAAETAVIAGENWVAGQTIRPLATCSVGTSSCPDTAAIWPYYNVASTLWVKASSLADSGGWFTSVGRQYGGGNLSDPNNPSTALASGSQPRYIVEDMGPDLTGSLVTGQGITYRIYYYRISGRGVGSQSGINTVTQSVVAKGF